MMLSVSSEGKEFNRVKRKDWSPRDLFLGKIPRRAQFPLLGMTSPQLRDLCKV